MKNERNIEEEVSKTLASLQGIDEVKPRPYFYTRLKAKMESKEVKVRVSLKWSMAAIAIFILMNMFSLISFWSYQEETEEAIEMMASEYNFINKDIYSSSLE